MSKGGREDTYQRANGHVRSSRRLQDSWSPIVIRRRRVGDCRYAFTAVVEKRFGSWLCRAPVPSRLPTRGRASVVAANPAFSSPTSSQKKRGLRGHGQVWRIGSAGASNHSTHAGRGFFSPGPLVGQSNRTGAVRRGTCLWVPCQFEG